MASFVLKAGDTNLDFHPPRNCRNLPVKTPLPSQKVTLPEMIHSFNFLVPPSFCL